MRKSALVRAEKKQGVRITENVMPALKTITAGAVKQPAKGNTVRNRKQRNQKSHV